MKNIRHINSMPKTGTSRAYRKSILAPAEEIVPEERKPEEFLSLTTDMAGRIKYFNFQNEEDKTWTEFFTGDPTFVLADILSFDSRLDQAGFEKEIRQLQYSLFIGESGDDKWHDLMHRIFDLLVRADGWLSVFKRTDSELSGFRKELWSTRGELQASLNDLIRLHHRFEEISGHAMDLTLDSLNNFESVGENSPPARMSDEGENGLTEKMIDELVRIYREFSNNLHYLKNAADRYFSRSFLTRNHEPHIGLYVTFLQLYRELSENFNDYTARHRSFFYDKVLRLCPQSATPDKAILIFNVSEGNNYVTIPENTLFSAGQSDEGEEIVFKTTSPLALNRAEITGIRTFLLGSNKLYKPSGKYAEKFVTGVYVADQTDMNFSGVKWPLLGEDQTGFQKQNRTMNDALVGFALSSPAFFLKDGVRSVKLQFHISAESYKDFLNYTKNIVRSEKKSDDIIEMEEVQALLIRLFMDGFLLDYTSDEGWVEKLQFFIDIKKDSEEQSDAILEVSFILQNGEPAVAAFNANVHGLSFRKTNPVIRLRLNPDAHLFPYSVMRWLKITSISCDINVTGLNDLVVYNDIGLVNSTEAFFPFGPVPVRKSWMAVSHPEAFNKNIDTVSLELTWEQLPDLPYGFHDFYSGYPGTIDNQSFKVRTFELDESLWKPLEKKDSYLFRTEHQRQPNCPEPMGRLSDVTRIENISLVNTSVVDRPEQINTIPEYTSKTAQGFIKIALTAPDYAFGHKQYPLLMSNTFLQNAKMKKSKNMVNLPNEPYTPLLRRITMDYHQSFNNTVKENSERGGVDLYHIKSFDDSVIINADLQDETEFLFPQANTFKDVVTFEDDTVIVTREAASKSVHRGQIIFEITGAKPPQVLSLFFQLRENIKENTITEMPIIGWDYYANDEWWEFSPDAVIRDGTNGFMNSGIVVLDLPEILRNDEGYRKTNTIMIRAFADDHAEIVGRAVGIKTQAAEVERVLTDGYKQTSPIPAGTISSVKGSFPGLSAISQPLPSYGGTSPENRESFIIRVSEHLKHRGKAVVSRDFERLVLQKFDEVRMVDCLPGVSTVEYLRDPGKVLVVVIPDVERYPDTSRFRPRFSAGKLNEIEMFLKDKTSEFASVEVRNPRYERITVRCTVLFKEGIESGLYLKKLNNEISRYISPWCYDSETAIEFGVSLDLTNIRGFIHSRPYVKMVTGLSAIQISVMSQNLYELSDTARLEADNESTVRELGDEIQKKLAVEITKKLRNSTAVEGQKRESVRAKLRILVRRTLRRYKYPPDKQKAATELVMKQAEVMADKLSGGVVIKPTRAWSVMVSDKNHSIRLIDKGDEREPEKAGIENLKLGDSFIICE